jgi:hypothetical protein
MSERRSLERQGPSERRSFPRPPLWLNLLLLLLGIAGVALARMHRERVATEFSDVINEQARTPAEIRRMKDELAEMDLSRGSLQRELEGRLKFAASLKSEDFYLSIDTSAHKLRFYYGDTVLREADVTIGESRTVKTASKSWTFVPVKGAFPVEAKLVHYAWPVPEWAYAMNGQPVPAALPVVPDGLGAYVLLLPNGYAIHTPPAGASPLHGAKPGSYMVAEDVLMAIWPRIHAGTQVYIF